MSNMGYCRFENTLPDLRDCYEHINDDDLSDREIKYRRRLLELCALIASEYEDDEYGEE